MVAGIWIGTESRRLVQPPRELIDADFHIRLRHQPQFHERIGRRPYAFVHRLDRRWRIVGRCGRKRCLGCSSSGDGGGCRFAEFKQFEWKLEQFQQWIVRWRRGRGMVIV
jgi:hypothetical protein